MLKALIMNTPTLIHQIKQRLTNVKGRSLSPEERAAEAITIAAMMLQEAQRIQTSKEKNHQLELYRMISDPHGKFFTMSLTDQCFRSHNPHRVASQILQLIKRFGIPRFLPLYRRMMMAGFELLGYPLANLSVPLIKHLVREETAAVILPGEPNKLFAHISKRKREGVRINLNHLGEAILGEEEAKRRLNLYLEDLMNPEVGYISIKISTLFSQLNLLAWDDTVSIVSNRLKHLYRAAQHNAYTSHGVTIPKFVNLDMEEYRDLQLTIDIFRHTLDDPKFKNFSAGLALQSYLPDSFKIQQELTLWAMERVAQGGAPISIRIVKGANLAMEQVEASIRGWPQAPYTCKEDVDANYKRMLAYACIPEHAKAVHVGVASHNLFDIAYGLLLRSENQLEGKVTFEMLEGMADHMRRVVQEVAGDVLLYCPAATEHEFQNAVAYLIRRLDENTAPENFLRQAFSLKPGTAEWDHQAELFQRAVKAIPTVSENPNRQQNRLSEQSAINPCATFENEPDTDWTLTGNRQWAKEIYKNWSSKHFGTIPLVIAGQEITDPHTAIGYDPSKPEHVLYNYTLAQPEHVERALQAAEKQEKIWKETTVPQRMLLLKSIAAEMRIQRNQLIGAMVADTGKTIHEADVEVSEAIDFAEYYAHMMGELATIQDIEWQPKGTIMVAPPWNFPCSIAAGGILTALVTGNCVIFKPAPEAILIGWTLAQIFWKAGVDKSILQFITCEDEPVGSMLVKDPRIAAVVLTGATATAKHLLGMRPGMDLIAETGGKNAIIVSNMADRDLAIKDIVQSGFGHAGQKCSACSLAICHSEVYNDPHFRRQLRDAAVSLRVGPAWDPSTRVNPLIHPPNATLMRGLSLLEEGEEWLLEPKQDSQNPNLWSPGIKLGVKEQSFTYRNELFGPVVAVMCADDLDHAIKLANGTPYGLTSGLHSLDEMEVIHWLQHIEAGNCYVNRGITGAVVQRQPFGGCKESSFGKSLKAGGPNYLTQFMTATQLLYPLEQEILPPAIVDLDKALSLRGLTVEEKDWWSTSTASYAFYYNNYFVLDHDPSRLLGQDNLLRYLPYHHVAFRIQQGDALIDIMRVIAAAMTCGTLLTVSADSDIIQSLQLNMIPINAESEEDFIAHLIPGQRVRLLQTPSQPILEACAEKGCHLIIAPVLANGRLELLNYLHEVSISIDYHRYGNLGEREGEQREQCAVESCCSKESCCQF
jgi:RHH-type proline utilization regulon transcriptional repressor/proline dehydrogenase/delta 1-pyrroline-5-carboxylate dehydrogenase